MQTILKSAAAEIRIDTDGPVIMIGEKINPTGRKKLAQALKDRDFDYVRKLCNSRCGKAGRYNTGLRYASCP